jgi:hypothetical protein
VFVEEGSRSVLRWCFVGFVSSPGNLSGSLRREKRVRGAALVATFLFFRPAMRIFPIDVAENFEDGQPWLNVMEGLLDD